MSSVGKFLRQRRKANGVTQAQLAIRAGTSQAAISMIERDERDVTVQKLAELLEALGEELTLGSTPMPHRYERRDLVALLAKPMGQRLEEGIAANQRAHAFYGLAAEALRSR